MPAKKSHNSKVTHLNIGDQRQLPLFLIILFFFVGFFTHLFFTVIFAQSTSDDVIHACANKRSGELRIITDHKDYREGKREKEKKENKVDKNGCRENEIALQWNKEGPQGPPGPSGSGGGGESSLPFICPGCSFGTYVGDMFAGKDLSNAILVDTSFSQVNFSGTNLTNAKLMESTIENANFSGANLENANLQGTQLEGAVVDGTKWKNTICPDSSNSDGNSNTCEGHLTPAEE